MVSTAPKKGSGYSFSSYSLPKYIFLDLPRDVIRSVARFRLHVRTLCFETATWNPTSSPSYIPVICVKLMMMSRMNSMLFSSSKET